MAEHKCCGKHNHDNVTDFGKQEGCGCGNHEHHHHEEGHEHEHHGHEHHGHDMGVILLETDDGEEIKCNVIGQFELNGKEYIALIEEGQDTVYLYGFAETADGPVLANIEDDEEFENVTKEFWRLVEEDEKAHAEASEE